MGIGGAPCEMEEREEEDPERERRTTLPWREWYELESVLPRSEYSVSRSKRTPLKLDGRS